MDTSKRIPRATALALALGLGVAVATGHGTASAAPDDSGTASAGSGSDTAGAASEPKTAPDSETGPAGGSDEAQTGTAPGASDSATTKPDADDDAAAGDASPESEEQSFEPDSGTIETLSPPAEAVVPELADPAVVAIPDAEGAPGGDTGSPRGSDHDATGASRAPAAPAAPTLASTDGSANRTAIAGGNPVEDANPPELNGTSVPSTLSAATPDSASVLPARTTAAAVDLIPQASPPAPPAPLGAIGSLISAFVALFTTPFLSSGPAAPAGSLGSFLELVFVAQRRVQSFFFNSSPTVSPSQLIENADGTITGTVGASDVDGDALRYTVIQGPANGSVVVAADGTYTYTPAAALAATGGVDTFKVLVDDNTTFHFHGLESLLTLGGLLSPVFGLPAPGTRVATVSVTVASPTAPALVAIGVGDGPHAVALSPDGARAVVSNVDGNSVSVIDTATNRVIATINNVGNRPTGVAVSAAGLAYVANQFEDTVSVIDLDTNAVTARINVGATPQSVALGAGGAKLYVVNTNGDTVSVIDTVTNRVTGTIAVGATPQAVAVSANGARAYVTNSEAGTVSVIDTATDTVTATVSVPGEPQAVAVSPDGTRVYVTGFDTGKLSVIDTTNMETTTIGVDSFPDAVAVSADGSRVYVANSQNGSVTVIDAATNTVLGSLDAGATAGGLALSADGATLYAPNRLGDRVSVLSTSSVEQPVGALGGGIDFFHANNFTDKPITFRGYTANSVQPFLGPKPGTVIPSGGAIRFSIQQTDDVNPLQPPKFVEAIFVDSAGDTFIASYSNGKVFGPRTFCGGGGGGGQCKAFSDYSIAVLPRAGSTVRVPGTNTELQAAVLNNLCDTSNCAYNATSQVLTRTPFGDALQIVRNDTPVVQTPSITFTETETQTDTVEITVKAGGKVQGIVNVEITAKYGHTWTDTHTFTQTIPIAAQPFKQVVTQLATPVFRVTGDFKVVFEGVTYQLDDAVFVTPIDTEQQAVNFEETPIVRMPTAPAPPPVSLPAGAIGVGDGPHAVVLSPDGTRAVVSNVDGNSVSVIDTATNRVIATINDVGNRPTGVAVSADGKAYVANQFEDTVSVIDLTTNTVTARIAVGDTPQAVALGAGKAYVVNANGDTVSVIDLVTNRVTATIAVGQTPQAIAITRSGRWAYVTNSEAGTVSVIDTAFDSVTATVLVPGAPQAVAVSPDGTKVYVTGFDTGGVSVIDAATNTVTTSIAVGSYPDAVAVSADGTRVYVANSQDGSVSVIDAATATVLGTIDAGATAGGLALSADGATLYAPNLLGDRVLALSTSSLTPAPPQGQLPGNNPIRQFYAYNLTDKPITFTGYADGSRQPFLGPKRLTVIPAGGFLRFDLQPVEISSTAGVMSLDVIPIFVNAAGARFTTRFTYNAFINPNDPTVEARCSGSGVGGRCSGISADTVVLLPPDGTVVNIPGTNPELQSAVLNKLCGDDNCSYDAQREELVLSPFGNTNQVNRNNTSGAMTVTRTVTDTTTQTDSVEVTVKVGGKIKALVDVELMAKYGHTWSETHTYTTTVPVAAPAFTQVTVQAAAPAYRVTGDFKVVFKGVTFLLDDVVFVTPVTDQQLGIGYVSEAILQPPTAP